MHCHQVLTGACNIGDRTFAVGRVEGVPFTAYAAGCNVVILASDFERVQVIPGVCHDNVQISCIDCSTDTGKIAAAYGKRVCIFEPSPISATASKHQLDYAWVQTGAVEADCCINNVSWNLEGTRLITAGDKLQIWAPRGSPQQHDEMAMPVMFDLGNESGEAEEVDENANIGCWDCIWEMTTSQPTQLLSFSPDGCLFATCGANDRLIKLWYDNSHLLGHAQTSNGNASASKISFSYVYLPHPAAVTGFTWRSTSKYMPRGSVSNMVVSSCRDNICRVWVETVLPDDGLLAMSQLDPIAAQNPRFRTHRHKHKFISRLKHIKACFGQRRQSRFPIDYSASNSSGFKQSPVRATNGVMGSAEPIPTMPTAYSMHDFPSYGFHAMGVTPGFHFHLAASINAATDIPLVPSLSSSSLPGGGPDESEHNFVLHWLNNKEMHFTQEAENILLEVSKKALEKDIPIHAMDTDRQSAECGEGISPAARSNRRPSNAMARGRSAEEEEMAGRSPATHPNQMSAATSSTSIATDINPTTAALGDTLDRRIEALLRNWLQNSDMLFSVHPVDGSLLLWILDFLDDFHGSFRQTQVSFCARIPNALPLGDAMTMSPHLALYSTPSVSFVQQLLKLEANHELECRNYKAGLKYPPSKQSTNAAGAAAKEDEYAHLPVVCMTTKHANGSLNLWHLTVEEGSKFTHVLNILHQRRVCGHRFQLNAVKCHPELPLLLTTSHHNVQQKQEQANEAPIICVQDSGTGPWCSELLVWRVDGVGPLGRSGGLTELARLNSPHPTAFSTAAWIPALLPSSSLGHVCNSPSACFVASDGQRLRVYQAVLDGRALLAEMSMAERRNRRGMEDSMLSISTEDSSLREHPGHTNLGEVFTIVSEQSTARPGCVLQLSPLDDSEASDTVDSSTLLLHVYHEGLVSGLEEPALVKNKTSSRPPTVEEPFYVTRLLQTSTGVEVQMWRLVLATQQPAHDLSGSPDATEDNEDVFAQSQVPEEVQNAEPPQQHHHHHLPDAAPVVSKTAKVCSQMLPLPTGVSVIHAAPSAGHSSSACIYPACRAPYLLTTACSDNKLRFWKCAVSGSGDNAVVEWREWNMMSRTGESSIELPGVPLHVSCAYSGRLAVAYLPSERDAVVTPVPDNGNSSQFSCKIAVYECESTGGGEWIMCDPVTVEDVVATDAWQLEEQLLDQAHVTKVAHCRTTTTNLVSVLSSDNIQANLPKTHSVLGVPNRPTGMKPLTPSAALAVQEGATTDALRSVSSMLHVPSMSTLHSLRSQKYSKRGVHVKQRQPVQVDWVSKEDGSFLLTVAVGSKIIVLSDVSDELAANLSGTNPDIGKGVASKVSIGSASVTSRPSVLKKSLSVHQITLPTKQKYLELSRVQLRTADNLAPLPMSVGWAREGLLVVGMDNEMHCYTQWTNTSEGVNNVLALLHPKSTVPAGLHPACAPLFDDSKRAGDVQFISPEPFAVGIMEASQVVFNVLPLYHPRQLHELLNSGKIRRVKAILAHLLRYLTQLSGDGGALGGTGSVLQSEAQASWARTRTLSINAPHSSGSREGRTSFSLRPEEISNLMEVKTVPPMPLWQLLEADKENTAAPQQEKPEETYAELFGGALPSVDDDDLKLDDDDVDRPQRRTSVSHENRGLTYFGPRQTQQLAALLTHTQLPGLSSLDQMHLLALSDTVASCNVDFADKFDISKAKEAMAKESYSRSVTDEPSMESLDDCGLRFLLSLRHHTYLLRCLPLGQRSALQRSGIACHNIVWAFHSESQEELLQFVPSVRHGNPRWSELRELGVGWWVRNNTVLTKLILVVAKSAFQMRKDPLDAAIYYLAMKKKSLVWGLFRSIEDRRMTEFFGSDFTQERWRKAALKNAFALMGKQRFEHAAAFFLLAGALKDAIEVVMTQLHDEQLAMVIIRLYEGELEATPPALKKMLYSRVLGRDEDGNNEQVMQLHPDPFLRSMAYWVMGDYSSSLQTLLNTDPTLAILHPSYDESKAKNSNAQLSHNITNADPTVFNFYIYLRTHPLLIRQCIANTAKDTGVMASCLTVGADHLDKKSAYESSMTPQERCLYFTTAYAHLQAGCPVVALEVLSKLPDCIHQGTLDTDATSMQSSTITVKDQQSISMVQSGTLGGGAELGSQAAASLDWSSGRGGVWDSGPAQTSSAYDWSSSGFGGGGGGGNELQLDFTISEEDEEEDMEEGEKKQELLAQPTSRGLKVSEGGDSISGSSATPRKTRDVMAQQFKFIACLKIMMSELGTLGSSVDCHSGAAANFVELGGQLRHELHLWLEREVAALKELCGYAPALPDSDVLVGNFVMPPDLAMSQDQDQPCPTLHDILQREKLQFENKLARASLRKRWLAANQQLLHTLLGYCSLHGCSGGGLTLVRLELLLLLQELQQDAAGRNMLLSPLPCPTTLPLLSAVVASNKTVVADPVKQLQNLGEDLLATVVSVHGLGRQVGTPQLLGKVAVLRDLAIALSSAIHQALSDSEPNRAGGLKTSTGTAEESLEVTTQPGKWPGVTSLLCLMTREKDEEAPKLSLLLCESLVGVYLCLLAYGLVTCDAAILYRLVSRTFSNKEWALLFGGGAKRTVKVSATIPSSVLQGSDSGSPSTSPAGGEMFLTSTLSSLQKTRLKFNMKLLGQLGFQEARSQTQDGEAKPAFREQFVSPRTSIVAFLMSKPVLPPDDENIDYDSAGSDEEEIYEAEDEEDDIFREPKILAENKEHSDHRSYSWCLLRLASVKRAQAIVKNFLTVPQMDVQELAVQSPLLHGVLHALHTWTRELTAELEELQGPPPEYIPGCFAQSVQPGAPALSKYRALREPHNTPFAHGQKGVTTVSRLWQYLVRQEDVVEVFVRYIFARKRPVPEPQQAQSYAASVEDALSDSGDGGGGGGGTEDGSEAGGGGADHQDADTPAEKGSSHHAAALEPVRIIHKEQDNIAAFCINRVNSGLMSVATVKEVQELDISLLLQHPNWLSNTTELDLLAPTKEGESVNASNYLVVQCPADKDLVDASKEGSAGAAMVSSSSSLNAQTGRGASVIRSHKTEGARRMTAHPVLPVYLVGCQDGSVAVREWQHTGVVARPRPGGTFAKVTRLHFNQQGNKFGVMDADGNLSLYHLGLGSQVTKPFYTHQCHNKHGSDFAFVGSSSVLATCGQSSDHRNVALWDTLMPARKANIVAWLCHESGTAAMLYAPQHQVILTAGKKGTVCIFDVRQRTLRHRFQAHESAIKCLALDPSEEFFVSGAADGDIKVWGLAVHNLIYNLPGEHSRTSLFKNLSQGVTQLLLDNHNRLFSCGGDGSIKLRTFPERDLNLNLL